MGGTRVDGGERIFLKRLKNTVLSLENSNPNSRKYYLLFTIQFLNNPKTYFPESPAGEGFPFS